MRLRNITLIVGLISIVPNLFGQGRMSAPNYDPANEITLRGTVEAVLTTQRGPMTGIHLKVKSPGKIWEVRVGPAWFLRQKQFTLMSGDQIDVTGARMAGDIVIAREIKCGDTALVLRDANGFPLWSRGRGRPNS